MKKCNIVVIDLVPSLSQDLVLAASNLKLSVTKSVWVLYCIQYG